MLKVGMIAQWLEKQGILENTELPGGRKRRLPTDEGLQLGIFTEQRTSMSGDEYTAVLYPPAAQEYIYSHIDEIADLNNGYIKPEQKTPVLLLSSDIIILCKKHRRSCELVQINKRSDNDKASQNVP